VVEVESAMYRSSAGGNEVKEMLSEEPGDNCSQMSLEVCLFRLMFIVSGVSRYGFIPNEHERIQSHQRENIECTKEANGMIHQSSIL
jgi:hypothetical protein